MRKELLEHRFNHSAWLALHERVVNLRNALMLTDLRLLKEKQDSRSVHDLTSLAVVTSRLIEEILNESVRAISHLFGGAFGKKSTLVEDKNFIG